MKALSLRQPWASLVAVGAKKYETRTWSTKYRGPLVIHASKAAPSRSINLAGGAWWSMVCTMLMGQADYLDPDGSMPRGQLLAIVELEDVLPTAQVVPTPLERSLGHFGPGRFAWHLTGPRRLAKPIPWKGRQGLFNLPDDWRAA